MKCHYEVLQIERTATADEIKKAYRKLALKWHPDKNVGNEVEATARFKEVTAAQTVLSDPHERKWYDDHREAILRGGSGTHQDSDDADSPIINLWPFFNGSCYSGFDGPEGFFAVYDKLFRDIYDIDGRDLGSEKQTEFYSFGNENSDQVEVFQFYSQWSGFVTQLSFSWEDEYNTLEAPNRQVKRAMEKENKKKRDVARKKYMETVRALVDYVKKRDIRYIRFERELRKRREEEELARARKIQETKEKKKQQRKAMREQMQGDIEEEEKFRVEERKTAFLLADLSDDEVVVEVNGNEGMLQEDVSDDDGDASEGEDDVEEEIYACEICKKEFKSEAQQQQHFTSKVHRKKAQEIAKQEKLKAAKMNPKKGKGSSIKKGGEVQLEEHGVSDKSVESIAQVPDVASMGKKKSKNKKQGRGRIAETFADSDSGRKTVSNEVIANVNGGDSESSSDDEDDLLALSQIKLSSKLSRNEKVASVGTDSSSGSDSDSDSDSGSDSKVSTTPATVDYEIITPGGVPSESEDNATLSRKKKGKSVASVTAAGSSGASKVTICKICGFDAQGSRNKLFQHVKDFGHAAYKEDIGGASSGHESTDRISEVTQTAQKMSKKDKKKKQKSETTRRNDYRF